MKQKTFSQELLVMMFETLPFVIFGIGIGLSIISRIWFIIYLVCYLYFVVL